jgi:hypothetical protein
VRRLSDTLRTSFGQHHLVVARLALGAYLFVHYLALLPYAAETFGPGGVLPSVTLNPAYPHGFTLLGVFDRPGAAMLLVAALAALSLAYLAGFFTRASAVLLFVGSHQLFHRNQLTLNPSLSCLGFLLLAHALFPADPPLSVDRLLARNKSHREDEDRLPRDLLAVLWIVTAVAYTYSGITKLESPSWRSGRALSLLLASALARDTALVRWVESLPGWSLAALTWGALLSELFFGPLAFHRRLRPLAWIALMTMHAGIVMLLDFADISMGMMAFQLFTFDPRWLAATSSREQAARGERALGAGTS